MLMVAVEMAWGFDDAPARAPAADGDPLEDPIEPFQPATPRTAEEQDRLDAVALFAAGRMREQAGLEHEQSGDDAARDENYSAALRLYERALRHDPDALPILRHIIRLAIEKLNRPAEALRYAIKAVELDPSNAVLLRQLGEQLKEQGDVAGALRLYEKALSVAPPDEKSAARVALRAEMARLYHRIGDYAQSAAAAAEVVAALAAPADYGLDDGAVQEILGEPGVTWDLFGESFLKAGRAEEAIAAFEKSAVESGDQGLLGFRLAQVHASSDPARALNELRKYFDARDASQGTAPYELLAQVLAAQGQSADLLPQLEQLLAQDGQNVPLGHYLAAQYQQAGQTDKAAALYEKLVNDSPTPAGYTGLSALYRQTKQAAPLLELLGKLAAQTGDLSTLGEEESQALKADTALVAAVLQAARDRLAADPQTLDYGGRLAAALLALDVKDYAAAGDFFRLAVESRPDSAAELMLSWGVSLLSAEQYELAIEVFQRAVETKLLADDNPVFHYYLSMAQEFAGRTDDALATAHGALALQPDSPRLQSRVAWILFHAKRYDDAAKAYEELIQKYDAVRTNPEVSRVVREARLVLSSICVTQKRIPEAEEWLEQVLDEYPEDVSAQNDLGYLWADQGKHLDRALQMAQNAVAAEPDNAAYLDTLGWCLFRLGRLDEAVAALEKASAGDKPDGVILEHLGDVYVKMGQTDKAVVAWQRALSRFDPNDDAEPIARTIEKLKSHGVEAAPPSRTDTPDTSRSDKEASDKNGA
jgi:tetratricopeptide (TPR) repeat protein